MVEALSGEGASIFYEVCRMRLFLYLFISLSAKQ
jgi:hypothetical protein